MLTELFGLGWPAAPHRVIANATTRRWIGADPRGPIAVRALNRALSPFAARLPAATVARFGALQRPGVPLYGPISPLEGDDPKIVDTAPLYAGESVARIHQLASAGEITRMLAG